jgi:hypothetical protein
MNGIEYGTAISNRGRRYQFFVGVEGRHFSAARQAEPDPGYPGTLWVNVTAPRALVKAVRTAIRHARRAGLRLPGVSMLRNA